MERVYKNSSILFIAVLLMVFCGFYRTYFGLFPNFANVGVLFHFHALMILMWMAVLITQPILIRRKNIALHRQIGKISYVVVVLMVLSIILIMRLAFIRNTPVPPGSTDIRLIGIADLTFFLLTYFLAIYYKRKAGYHARYMVLTVLPFLNPSLGRLGFPGPILALVIMTGLIIYEIFNEKVYKPYLIGLPAYLLIYTFFLIVNAEQWKAFWWMFF